MWWSKTLDCDGRQSKYCNIIIDEMSSVCTLTELRTIDTHLFVARSTNMLLLHIKLSTKHDIFLCCIFQAPTELGEFKNLFLFLGASLNPSVDQYAMVLKQIWKQTSGTKMHPNEIRAAFKVRWIRNIYLWKNYCHFIFWTNVVNIIFLKGLLTVLNHSVPLKIYLLFIDTFSIPWPRDLYPTWNSQ